MTETGLSFFENRDKCTSCHEIGNCCWGKFRI